MKLLFDQNLSYRLVRAFAKEFPGSAHVRHIGLERAMDGSVWDYAKENGFVIVSKDADFHQRSFLYGHPPKVVWIRRGNCSTATIELILREHQDDLVKFAESEQGSFLALLWPTAEHAVAAAKPSDAFMAKFQEGSLAGLATEQQAVGPTNA